MVDMSSNNNYLRTISSEMTIIYEYIYIHIALMPKYSIWTNTK